MKTRLNPAVVAISLALFLAPIGNAQTPPFEWAKRVASTTNSDNELSIGLAIDRADNLYVTGWFDSTNDFHGALTNTPGNGQDIFVAKYNSIGTLQWARKAGGNSSKRDGGRGIGVDNGGDVYVTGEFVGNADFDGIGLAGATSSQFFLAKYDSNGTIAWVRQSVGARAVYGTGLAVDGSGNCHAIGYIDNLATITFDANTSLTNTNIDGYGTFLVKYDSDGNVQWANLMVGPGQTYATKVAVDAAGNVYVRGSFSEILRIGNTQLVSTGSEQNMFIAKFTHSGDLTWVRQAEGGNVDEGGVAVDQSGNVYVSGAFESTLTFGGISLTNAGSLDGFVAKYSSSGTIQWARRAGGANLDFYWDVALDRQGNVYAGGVLSSDATVPSASGAIVAKYDPDGTLQWAGSASGPPADPVSSITAKCAVDAAGNCYLAGWYLTATAFGSTVLQPQGHWNFFLAKVDSAPLAPPVFGLDTFFFRMEFSTDTRIIEIDRGGRLTWSNAVTPTSFYVSGTMSLGPASVWHRVIYGETMNRTPTVQAPLANPLVVIGAFPRGTNLWIGRPFESRRKQIKSAGNRVRSASISRDERHILYTEEAAGGTDDYAVRHYDVRSDSTTTLVPHAGRRVAFDQLDGSHFFYIGSPATTVFRRALGGGSGTPWITDGGRPISSFDQSPDGNRILILSRDDRPPYRKRFVTFTSQGVFERLLLESAFDCYNSSFSPGGDQAVLTYRDGDCSGQRRVAIYNLNTGARRELPTIASNVWPSSSGALFISWSPYDGLLVLESKLFCSPVDGQVTGTWSAPAGYDVLGFDKDWRWHATDHSLVHILQLHKNP